MKKFILLGLIILFIGCPSAPKNSAKIYLTRGEYENAKEQIYIALKESPNDNELYCLLAFAEIGLARWIEASKAFQDAFKIDSLKSINWIFSDKNNIPMYWQAFYNAAFIHYGKKNYEEALIDLKYAKIVDPGAVNQYILEGGIYRELNKPEAANKAYQKALDIDPENPEAYYLIGKAKFENKEYESSIGYFNDAVKYFQIKYTNIERILFQNVAEITPELRHEIIKLWEEKENDELNQLIKVKLGFDGGLSVQKRNIELFYKTIDGLAQSYYLLGMSNYRLNKDDVALGYLKKTLEYMPEHHDALFYIGEIMIRFEKYNEAIGYFEKLTQLKSDDIFAWFYIGASYLQLKDYNKAIEIYEEKVLKINPEFVEAMTNLASAYQSIGNSKKALEWLIKVEEIQKGRK